MDSNPHRLRIAHLVLGSALALLGFLWTMGEGRDGALARASYDGLQSPRSRSEDFRTQSEAVIVYLDLSSHRTLNQDPAGRWDRMLHARLLDRLHAAGARAVVFDILFDGPSADPQADQHLAAAIKAHGQVILAAENHVTDQAAGSLPGVRVRGIEPPYSPLRDAAAGWGAAELAVDPDFVVRRSQRQTLGDHPTLAWITATTLGLRRNDEPPSERSEWLSYYGPPLALPHVSYQTVLDPQGVDPSTFRDKVVFVGALPMASVYRERRDELRSPFSRWGGPGEFMPGVEVHATEFLNWARRESWRRLGRFPEAMLLAAAGFLLGVLTPRVRPAVGALSTLGACGAGYGLAWLSVTQAATWFPWLIVTGLLAPGSWLGSVLIYTVDWRRQRLRLEGLRRADARRIARQAALIDQARDLILVTTLDGTVQYANPSARAVLGENPSPLLSPKALEERRAELLRHGAWSGPIHHLPDGAAPLILDCRCTLLRDDAGEPESILMIGTDVTEQRRLELDFLRAQKWEAVGSLAGGMAHDLNNTLAPALLGLQVLHRGESRPDIRKTLAMIETNTRRGIETVRQVLQFLRGGSMQTEALDPIALLRELESLIRETFPREIRVASILPSSVGPIHGNAGQLQQALLNLCLNARDAMPAGGQLTFVADDVDLTDEEASRFAGGRPGAFLLMAVSDSGEGIPEDRLQKIFDPLFTTKADGRGTGLGLSSVLRIVQQHHGFVAVTSEVGAGSTFELYLPRTTASPPT